MAEQLSFPQPRATSYAAEDFFQGEASAVARAMLDDTANWPQGKLILFGEPGAGKTHLAQIWAARMGAEIFYPPDFPPRADVPVVIDKAEAVAGDAKAEEALFHLHNNMVAAGKPLLLIARRAPSAWGITLPDLRSRMEATTIARIEEPDDETLGAILLKLMNDRQLSPAPNLVPYLTRRMSRSYEDAARLVDTLDGLSLAEKREITTALASRILDGSAD